MPRQEIELKHRIDYLSILNETGKLDQDLEPDLAAEVLQKMHRMIDISSWKLFSRHAVNPSL